MHVRWGGWGDEKCERPLYECIHYGMQGWLALINRAACYFLNQFQNRESRIKYY